MAVTKSTTFSFENQVRFEYTRAYFRKLLLWSRFGKRVVQDFNKKPGKKLDVPIFQKMGAAEKPGEDDRLNVDSLGDKSFSCVVYEVGKAWGITNSGRYRMGSTQDEWEDEAGNQAARVLAEQVDSDALSCLNNDGNSSIDGSAGNDPKGNDAFDDTSDLTLTSVFTSKKGSDVAAFKEQESNIDELQTFLTDAFGDRQSECKVIGMHSKAYNSTLTNKTTGILKADANSPFQGISGYGGNWLGKETFMIDNISTGPKRTITDSNSATQKYNTRKVFALKPNAFLLLIKQDGMLEAARDILGRIDYWAITQWYTFYPLHKQNDSEDVRAASKSFLTNEQTT